MSTLLRQDILSADELKETEIFIIFLLLPILPDTLVSDINILNLLSDCKEGLNIKARVELSCNSLIGSPMLIGFFHPEIVLPARKLENKELSCDEKLISDLTRKQGVNMEIP